ncbi:hypothetical protein REPUB_Repub08aG0088300 [Reevesia pubescens]
MWYFEKNKIYSVRSAYKMMKKQQGPDLADAGISNAETRLQEQKIWTRVWNGTIPTKIKVFSWRATREFLPVFWNLWKMRVVDHPICPRCLREEETCLHALRNCSTVIDTWTHANLDEVWLRPYFASVKKWIQAATNKLDQGNFEMGMSLCWAIWTNRNTAIKNQFFYPQLK